MYCHGSSSRKASFLWDLVRGSQNEHEAQIFYEEEKSFSETESNQEKDILNFGSKETLWSTRTRETKKKVNIFAT